MAMIQDIQVFWSGVKLAGLFREKKRCAKIFTGKALIKWAILSSAAESRFTVISWTRIFHEMKHVHLYRSSLLLPVIQTWTRHTLKPYSHSWSLRKIAENIPEGHQCNFLQRLGRIRFVTTFQFIFLHRRVAKEHTRFQVSRFSLREHGFSPV